MTRRLMTPKELTDPHARLRRAEEILSSRKQCKFSPKPSPKTRPGRGPACHVHWGRGLFLAAKERFWATTYQLLFVMMPRVMRFTPVDQVLNMLDNGRDFANRFLPSWFQLGTKPQSLVDYFWPSFTANPCEAEAILAQLPNGGDVLDDREFAYQQLNGYAPYFIRKVKGQLPAECVVTESDVRSILRTKNASLAQLIKKGKLYMIDFTWAGNALPDEYQVKAREHDLGLRSAPIALFYVDDEINKLMPLAIQLLPKDCRPFGREETNPVFTPACGSVWTVAKLMFNHSVLVVHTAITHVASPWWTCGPIISMRRTVSEDHPISNLTDAFFDMAVGKWPFFFAQHKLMPNASGHNPIFWAWWKTFDYTRDFNEARNIADRDVDDIPEYYWRDDTKKLYACYERLVRDVVDKAYPTDETLKKDHEIQAYVDDVNRENFIPKLPFDTNGFETKQELVDFITPLMYFSSAKVNYNTNAWPYYAWQLSAPTFLKAYPPTDKRHYSTDDILAMLPQRFASLPSLTRWGVLACYKTSLQCSRVTTGGKDAHRVPDMPQWLADHRYVAFRRNWFDDLNNVEEEMKARNQALEQEGKRPFTFLLPTLQCNACYY